ncbi:MAG TPA: thioesterase family protein [Solirubrobacterales bacterium]|nr:thioesterase family protein [Solirubrobacterales bacterium]
MPESFYERDGDRFLATGLTRGPWDPGAQHAGPPAALLARAFERLGGGRLAGGDGPPAQVGRVTFEIVGSVPIAPVRVEAEVLRPGKRVELVAGTLRGEDGRPLIWARGWRLRRGEVQFPDPPGAPRPMPGPGRGKTVDYVQTDQEDGYHSAMEVRFVTGAFLEPGPARVWLRMKVPLIAGEDPSPLERVLIAADAGNGVSAPLDWRRFLFINVDLSVHLHRMPEGEWIGLDAVTVPEHSGIGMSDSALHDERGRIGRAAQTLLVDGR